MIRHDRNHGRPAAKAGTLLAIAMLAGACAAGGTSTGTSSPPPTPPPTATQAVTPAPTETPSPVPTPSPIAYGAATVVRGTESCTFEKEGSTTTDADGTGRYRGAVLACTDTSNDPRVSGSATYTWEYDGWGQGATVQWGTGRLENAGGAWDGTLTGSYSTPRGDVLLFWFKGSGGYEGLSYAMWAVLSPAEVAWTYPVDGIIFPGSPPAPKPGDDAALRQAATGSPGPAATPTVVPEPAATTEPTPEPYDYGPATIVSGIEACEVKEGTATVAEDGTTQSRGWLLTCTDTINDPRVSGSVTYSWNYDMWGSGMEFAHVQWGSGRLENAGGAWEGTLTGSFSTVNGDIILFWFEGTGGYEGLAYGMWAILSTADASFTYPVKGIIFPGSPPTP
jgi:hypothetical protein